MTNERKRWEAVKVNDTEQRLLRRDIIPVMPTGDQRMLCIANGEIYSICETVDAEGEFAEWCSENKWTWILERKAWRKLELSFKREEYIWKTTSELKAIYRAHKTETR